MNEFSDDWRAFRTAPLSYKVKAVLGTAAVAAAAWVLFSAAALWDGAL